MTFCCTDTTAGPRFPDWVPADARHYLAHTVDGEAIRKLARDAGCHASTVLRQVRRIETLRDDPLVDGALSRLGAMRRRGISSHATKERAQMTDFSQHEDAPDEIRLAREARRVLRRLCERGAVLAVATEMDKAVVVRDTGRGRLDPHGGGRCTDWRRRWR